MFILTPIVDLPSFSCRVLEFPPVRLIAASAIILICLASAPLAPAAERTGEAIYKEQCASCHGGKGEGNQDEYPQPLVGDRPLKGLSLYISQKMPDGEPETCTGADAEKVAAYIYDAFYSRAAQARLHPLRRDLARLTVTQYRQTLADLIGTFIQPGQLKDERGLRGEYYNNGKRLGGKSAIDRRDPVLDFDFGDKSPDEKIKVEEFAIRWQGGVLIPESGEYEFVLQTTNGAKLWVSEKEPLIDAWVRSGDQSEYRASIYLLGGRVYPVRVEFFKEKREKTSAISLKWKRPGGVDEVIPERQLSPGRYSGTYIVSAAFPPDDRSMGYERGTAISRAWDDATTQGAIETAGFVVDHISQLAGTRLDAGNARDKLQDFSRRFVERAFRRPLTAEQEKFFVTRHFEGEENLELALKKVVILALKSPRFLYREPGSELVDPYAVASRISYGLWDTIPDRQLLEAASRDQLKTREQVAAQVERMLPDERTKAKIREFFYYWLYLNRFHDVSKDPEKFPEFTPADVSDLRTSLELFLDDVVWSEQSDFRQLLLADFLYLNGRLAKLYGADLPENAPFEKVTLADQQRSGILSHPLLMTGFAYHATSSPIHRGVFVARSLLGRNLRPPPDAVTPTPPDLHPDLTTRERINKQTQPQQCRICHGMINPLGFALENFDAVGRFRVKEKGKPINSDGGYQTLAGQDIKFSNARELGNFLANSPEVHAAFVEKLFHHMVKQPLRAYGYDRPEKMREQFEHNGYNVRKLLVEVITASALPPPPEKNGSGS